MAESKLTNKRVMLTNLKAYNLVFLLFFFWMKGLSHMMSSVHWNNLHHFTIVVYVTNIESVVVIIKYIIFS